MLQIKKPYKHYTETLLQAVSDWQRGGNAKQKEKRGRALKGAMNRLPKKYKSCGLYCLRQIAIEKGSLWRLADQLKLPETISSWTVSPTVASQFKGGVPPKGLQGIIFGKHPPIGSVIANISALYRDQRFLDAIEVHRHKIEGFHDGMGKYRDTQFEVVLEIGFVELQDIYALGGYSSSSWEIAQQYFGTQTPSDVQMKLFDDLVEKSRAKLGADWIEGEAKDRVLAKVAKLMPKLRKLKKLQDHATK